MVGREHIKQNQYEIGEKNYIEIEEYQVEVSSGSHKQE